MTKSSSNENSQIRTKFEPFFFPNKTPKIPSTRFYMIEIRLKERDTDAMTSRSPRGPAPTASSSSTRGGGGGGGASLSMKCVKVRRTTQQQQQQRTHTRPAMCRTDTCPLKTPIFLLFFCTNKKTKTQVENNEQALSNCVFVSKEDFSRVFSNPSEAWLNIGNQVFVARASSGIEVGGVALNGPQRTQLSFALGDEVPCKVFKPKGDSYFLSDLLVEVDKVAKTGGKPLELTHDEIVGLFQERFMGHFFTAGQVINIRLPSAGTTLFKCVIKELLCVDMAALMAGQATAASEDKKQFGMLVKQTSLAFVTPRSGAEIRIEGGGDSALGGGGGTQTTILNPDFNFEKMGIGGLDSEFSAIFRRAFASRIFPAREIAKYGVKHVRGMLLFGPPGTGKTLMARQIGKMLNATEPKIISGPEILNKFVGASEEKVRELFKDAEEEYKQSGDESALHIIIFDEIDAICKQRGSRPNDSGVGDTVVNQLLAKLDGVNTLNNILVIGMTNRKELIDEALLRPGRLEVHMEIGLPDEHGRLQILSIHTGTMKKNNKLAQDVSLEMLAKKTKNFSGAEIEGLVKSATAFALNEVVNADDVGKNLTKVVTPTVKMAHFECALKEVIPAFGLDESEFETLRGAITPFSADCKKLMSTLKQFATQVQKSDRTPLLTVLLDGSVGSGKTSVALDIALGSDFPFVKLINPTALVAYNESARCERIAKVFQDAHKSPLSVIVIDDIERLIDYVAIGPRFSNAILQVLATYLRMPPPKGRKLMVIGTTSKRMVLESMEIAECFHAQLVVPNVMTGQEAVRVLQAPGHNYERAELKTIMDGFNAPIPVKKLLLISEMAKQGAKEVDLGTRFLEALELYHRTQ